MSRPHAHRESGQAAVETALSMPLMLFFVLMILQMGLLMQARNLTQYAVFRATRAGSVNHGDCVPMLHAAIASLIPSFVSYTGAAGGVGSNGTKLGNVFRQVTSPQLVDGTPSNKFVPSLTQGQAAGYTETILWLIKERPNLAEMAGWSDGLPNGEYADWDQGEAIGVPEPIRLEVRIIYWYPLRLPFIDWVMTRTLLAQWGLETYAAQGVYAPTRTANWQKYTTDPLSNDTAAPIIKAELLRRARLKQYSFPLQASYRMRMMTPPRVGFFINPTCGFP